MTASVKPFHNQVATFAEAHSLVQQPPHTATIDDYCNPDVHILLKFARRNPPMMKVKQSCASATTEACAPGIRDIHHQRRAIRVPINYYLNKTGSGASYTSTFERSVSIVLRAFRTPVNCRAGGECSNGRAIRYRTLGSRGVFIVTSASRDLRNCESPGWTNVSIVGVHLRAGRCVDARTRRTVAFVATLPSKICFSAMRSQTLPTMARALASWLA
jgi:hypothetical protein